MTEYDVLLEVAEKLPAKNEYDALLEVAAQLPDKSEYDSLLEVAAALPESQAEPEPVTSDLGSRFGAALAENALKAFQGMEKIDRYLPISGATSIVRQLAPGAVQTVQEVARSAQDRAREDYGVGPADTLVEKVVEGAASLPVVLAAPPIAPLTNAALVGESQLQDAERYAQDRGGQIIAKAEMDGVQLTPEQKQEVARLRAEDAEINRRNQAGAFIGGAAMGAATEWGLGVPAMLASGGGRRLLSAAGLGFAREGTQEAVQELGSNTVARVLYDENRDLTEGVKEAGLVGGLIGAPTGAALQQPLPTRPTGPTVEDEILAQIEDRDEPDLTGFGSANPAAQGPVTEAPAPPPVAPERVISAAVLGVDPAELQQQEAIVSGQPVPAGSTPVSEKQIPVWDVLETPPTPAPEQMDEKSKVEYVPVSSLRGTQDIRGGVYKQDMVQGYGDKPVVVRLSDGTGLVIDGHHRSDRALTEGSESIEAYVIEASDYAPQLNRYAKKTSEPEDDNALLAELFAEPAPEAPVSDTPETVEAPLAPEEGTDTTSAPEEATAAPDGLSLVEPDTFERLADEPLREGWVGYQDPETLQVFQVPEGSAPEVVQQRLQEVRAEESDVFRAEREAALERELTQKRFDENVQRLLDEQNSREPLMRKDLTAGTKAQEVWSRVDQLTFTLDREKMRLAEAKKNLARLQSSANQRAKQDAAEEVQIRQRGVEILSERVEELQPKVQEAKKEIKDLSFLPPKGMKKGKKGEEGSTTIPDAVLDLGRSIYRAGMDFSDWSRAMVRNLGEKIRPVLRQVWEAVANSVNSLSPAGRRFKRSASAGGVQSDPEVYDVMADSVFRSKTDTRPNNDFTDADKQAIRDAYAEIQQKSGFGSVPIADVMEAAGMPLSNQSKGLLMQMYQDGEITSLNLGDWSLANNRKRAWAVRNQGDLMLSITMPQGMRRSAPAPEGGAVGSQGGRRQGPPEQTPPATPQEAPEPLSIKNENTAGTRDRLGMDPRVVPFRRAFGTVWNEAMAKVSQQPGYSGSLVAELAKNPRPTSDLEGAVLLYERVRRENEYDQALSEVAAAQTEGDVLTAQARLEEARLSQEQLIQATEGAGTSTARGLAIRKMLVNREYNLERMRAETRAVENNGGALTPEQNKRIEDLYKKLKDTQDKLKALEEKQSQQDALATFRSLMKDMNSERKEAVKAGKTVTEFLNEQAEAARERMRIRRRERGMTMNIATNPASVAMDLVDAVVIGASHIANGISSLSEFTSKIVEEFGEEFRQYVPQVYDEAQKKHDADKKAFGVSTSKPATPVQQTPADILKDAPAELDPGIVFELARAYVRQGVEGMENVMSAVHKDLEKIIPGLTIREVRDAFSGYGKVTYPSKAEDLVKLRQYKVLARLTSQLEDVYKRQAPLRTGPQRDKLSAEARILQKQINDLMKELGITTISPEQQLKTAADAVKTRLRNQIEELDRALQTNQALPTNRRTVQYDEEAKLLKARRDALKERYDSIFKPKGKTQAEKIQAILANLDKSIEAENQLLKAGIFKRPPGAPQPTSTEIENKRMELDAMRQLRRELYAQTQPRKSPEDVALEQAIKAAKKSIERMDEIFKSGNLTPQQRAARFAPTAELEALWSERDAMSDALAELRRAQKPRTDPEERARKAAIKALTKSIASLDQRMLNNDFSPTPRKANRPEVKEVAELRDLRDSMREAFNDLKKAQTPPKDLNQIRLEADKKVLKGRIKNLQEKIAKGDYAPTPKKDPQMDKEKRQLQYDYQKLRETYLKGLLDAQLKQRKLPAKIWGTGVEALNTSRAILTSADFSGVLRQGGFIAFGNPIRTARALPAMFKSFASEKAANTVKEEIRERPNYPLYQQAKLYLADDAPASLSQMEEAYMSRWANKIPVVAGSQRAYVTFLNKLRADSFDAMVASLTRNGTPTKDEAKAIANFVNVATGRGDLGKLAGIGVGLNSIFFAPRYVLSRFQLLAGQPFYGGNARTRKLIAKEYAKYLIGIGVVTSLLAAAIGDDDDRGEIMGFKVPLEMDPRSSDFLKVRIGNTRLDPFSGLLQATTLIERIRTEQTKTSSGEIVPLSGDTVKYGGKTTTDVMLRFLRTKLAPAPGAFVDWKEGKNVVGEKVGTKEVILRGLVPISAGEILETMKAQGVPMGTALSLLSMFGVGLQTYDQKAKAPKTKAEDYMAKPF